MLPACLHSLHPPYEGPSLLVSHPRADPTCRGSFPENLQSISRPAEARSQGWLVLMLDKLAFHLHDHDVAIVELRDSSRRPML
jgi:hypothetical protein